MPGMCVLLHSNGDYLSRIMKVCYVLIVGDVEGTNLLLG